MVVHLLIPLISSHTHCSLCYSHPGLSVVPWARQTHSQGLCICCSLWLEHFFFQLSASFTHSLHLGLCSNATSSERPFLATLLNTALSSLVPSCVLVFFIRHLTSWYILICLLTVVLIVKWIPWEQKWCKPSSNPHLQGLEEDLNKTAQLMNELINPCDPFPMPFSGWRPCFYTRFRLSITFYICFPEWQKSLNLVAEQDSHPPFAKLYTSSNVV